MFSLFAACSAIVAYPVVAIFSLAPFLLRYGVVYVSTVAVKFGYDYWSDAAGAWIMWLE